LNLAEYSSDQPIFIDANIFLDYTLPNTEFGDMVTDFLEKVELQVIICYNYTSSAERGLLYSVTSKRNDYPENRESRHCQK